MMAQAKNKKPSREEAQRLTEEAAKKQLIIDPFDAVSAKKAPGKKKDSSKAKK